jgi:uncharacterized membrane protein YczE
MQRENLNLGRVGVYLAGCVSFSLGAKCFIDSHLGVDPLDVMVIGIVQHIGTSMGIVSGAIAIAFLAMWSAWNRKLPPLSPFITMALVGFLIDLWNGIGLEQMSKALLPAYGLLAVGLLLAAYGSSLIIMSGIGIRIMDLVAITVVEKWRWPFYAAKLLFEVFFLTTGWLLGGPVGIGTVAFLCVVGPFIQPFMWANARFLSLPNHGMARANQAVLPATAPTSAA